MIYDYSLSTPQNDLYDITSQVRDAVVRSGVSSGLALVYCPHTTAGITINENADPDVKQDIIHGLDKVFPDRPEFQHAEGNSAAHMKSSAVGASEMVIVNNGGLLLGAWQGIYFCEFDAPRSRKFFIKIIKG
jgi:secondary thiamine-phosphate synthase enzyme